MYSIAAQDGLSVDQLAAANGISPSTELVTGTSIAIPPQSPVSASSTGTAPECDGDDDADDIGCGESAAPVSQASASGAYVVQPGDTLWGLAQRAGVSVASLAEANGLSLDGPLLAGSTISLTGSTTVPVSTTVGAASYEPQGAAAQGNAGDPPYPTAQQLTAAQVGQIGADNGATWSLTDAIAWQESGFNNDLVSSADARGIMQILPGTWQWIQHSLDTGTPLAPASATDNVRGGALMINWLLGQTGGDPAMAAAGYYQGLASVRQNGMYPDTQQYVQDVMALRARFGG